MDCPPKQWPLWRDGLSVEVAVSGGSTVSLCLSSGLLLMLHSDWLSYC